MDVESLAITAITNSISLTDCLSAFIHEKDKEPSWDGNIYVYKNRHRANKGDVRKVPVQVKGLTASHLNKEAIRFSIKKTDMQNYLHDGGVIFFVVYFLEGGLEKRIYYTSLLPVKLRHLTSDCKGKTKSIELKSFPDDNVEKEIIFLNFLQDKEKQASFVNQELIPIEEYLQNHEVESVSLSRIAKYQNRTNPVNEFLENESYFYVTLKGNPLPLPVSDLFTVSQYSEFVPDEITAGGKTFYHEYTREFSVDETAIRLGRSVKLFFQNVEPQKIRLNFSLAPKLDDAVLDLDFFLTILKTKQFEFGGNPVPLETKISKRTTQAMMQIHEKYKNLKRVKNLFTLLGLKTDIELSSLSNESKNNINFLIRTVLEGQKAVNLEEGLPIINAMDVGDQKVLLCFESTETPGEYIISDFFKARFEVAGEFAGKKYPVPHYSYLSKEDYAKYANINLTDLLHSYQQMKVSLGLYISAQETINKLILAYDDSLDKRKDLLQTAKTLAAWLLESSIEESMFPKNIRKLNVLEIIKRERDFTQEEKKYLYNLTEIPNQSDGIKVMVHLLLDNQIATETHFERLNQEDQDEIRTYPIFRFWKKNEEE